MASFSRAPFAVVLCLAVGLPACADSPPEPTGDRYKYATSSGGERTTLRKNTVVTRCDTGPFSQRLKHAVRSGLFAAAITNARNGDCPPQ